MTLVKNFLFTCPYSTTSPYSRWWQATYCWMLIGIFNITFMNFFQQCFYPGLNIIMVEKKFCDPVFEDSKIDHY